MTDKNRIYSRSLIIPADAIDENGPTNNVGYVQWMQDIAVEHYASIGGIEAQSTDATWVVREHRVESLKPAACRKPLTVSSALHAR